VYEPLSRLPDDYSKVSHFDIIAPEYESSVAAFKKPIFEAAYSVIAQLIPKHARIADIGCGPGYETIALSKLVPEKEVCAIDLSTEMIRLAFRNATEQVISNACFYQADIEKELPKHLYGRMDAIFCQLSFSYFSQHSIIANNFYRLLDERGLVLLIEPDDNVLNRMSLLTAKAAVPHLNDYYSRDKLSQLFQSARFKAFYWQELLPGIGLSIISK
jgi:ubiquinone/menaquinone biosynthesis C-methylase UbiE